MPLGCLLDVSRMPPKCPLGEIYKQQNNLFTADEACHVAVNMWGFKVSKRSVFAILSPGNHQESARDPIEKLVKIAYKLGVHNSFLRPYNLTSLQHYIITFSFFHFAISAFRTHQNNTPKNEARSDAEEDYRSLSAPRKWLEKFFQRAKSDLCGKQKASMLSLFG